MKKLVILFLLLGYARLSMAQLVTNAPPFNPNDPLFQQRVNAKMQQTQMILDGIIPPPKGGGLSPLAPEQDCNNAIPVCQQTYTQNVSYSGYGPFLDIAPNTTCLLTGETNSVWYIFTVQNSGSFIFTINTGQDYDFALYNITGTNCSAIPSLTPVRCNYSAQYGQTGLTLPTQAGNLSYDASQSPFMPGINVTAGQTYVLIVNNFTGNTTGYTLTFGGTASIFDQSAPTITATTASCPPVNQVTLTFSENVRCNSITGTGSEFSITGPQAVTVSSASGVSCGTGAFTNQLVINTSAITTPGTYTVTINNGTDGNTFLDNCNNALTSGTQVTFTVDPSVSISGATQICKGDNVTLTANPAGATSYTWNTGANTQAITVSPVVTTTYTVTMVANGCTTTANHTVTVVDDIQAFVTPSNVTICGAGTTTLTATALFGGSACPDCNYSWSHGVVQNGVPSSSVVVGPGTYTVTVTRTGFTCNPGTATANVNTTSGVPGPTCNNIYVTPTGTGNGLTPSSPTNLTTALGLAQCNNATIKMAVGDYFIDEPIVIGSYTTLEGGYNATFTQKTSSQNTSGAFPDRGTRIIRRNTKVDPGSPGFPLNFDTFLSFFLPLNLSIL